MLSFLVDKYLVKQFFYHKAEASNTCVKRSTCDFMCNMLHHTVILVGPAYTEQKVVVYHAIYLINILLI